MQFSALVGTIYKVRRGTSRMLAHRYEQKYKLKLARPFSSSREFTPHLKFHYAIDGTTTLYGFDLRFEIFAISNLRLSTIDDDYTSRESMKL